MAGHFDCIGLPVTTANDFGRLVGDLIPLASSDGNRLLWEDPSGARVAIFVDDDGRIVCAKPSFASGSLLSFAFGSAVPDANGCSYCTLTTGSVLEDGEMVYPLALEFDDAHLGALPAAPVFVTAFAERITSWPSEEAYLADPGRSAPGFASRSLVPSGLFSLGDPPRPPRAEAMITGIVVEAERRVNGLSQIDFDWCRLSTFGAEYEVVAAEHRFGVGQVVQGTFWLVGRRG